jgi:hypothetical protein
MLIHEKMLSCRPKEYNGLVATARNYNQEIIADPGLWIPKDQGRKFKSHFVNAFLYAFSCPVL